MLSPPSHWCQELQALLPAQKLRWAAQLADLRLPRRHGQPLLREAQPAVPEVARAGRQAAQGVTVATQLAAPAERAAAEGSSRAMWTACAASGARRAASCHQAAPRRHQRRQMLSAHSVVQPARWRPPILSVLLPWQPRAWLGLLETLQRRRRWMHLIVEVLQRQRRPLQVPEALVAQQRMQLRQWAVLAVVAGAMHCCPLPAEIPAQDTKMLQLTPIRDRHFTRRYAGAALKPHGGATCSKSTATPTCVNGIQSIATGASSPGACVCVSSANHWESVGG